MPDERRCVKCGQAMVAKMVEDVEIDYCPGCRGLWLDKDEINQLAAKTGQALGELRALVQEGGEGQVSPEHRDRPCPACGGKMTVVLLRSISLEHCLQCDGIFLDRGELDRAMEEFSSHASEIELIVSLARSVASGKLGG
jgi:Zn-finger nucleic acid-binding protein